MRLNLKNCQAKKTIRHTLPTGGLAITLPEEEGFAALVAYRKVADSPTWDWIRKGFRYFPKTKKKRG